MEWRSFFVDYVMCLQVEGMVINCILRSWMELQEKGKRLMEYVVGESYGWNYERRENI